jgi:hypothetical protein
MSARNSAPGFFIAVLAVLLALANAPGQGERSTKGTPAKARSAAAAQPDALTRLAQDIPVSATPSLKEYAPGFAARHLSWYATEEKLLHLLLAAPEVNLTDPTAADNAAVKELLKLSDTIEKKNRERHDAFVTELRQTRADLAGLAWQLGDQCKLGRQQAEELAVLSQAVRGCMDSATPIQGPPRPQEFWTALEREASGKPLLRHVESVLPALEQVVLAERSDLRRSVVEHLGPARDKQSTLALARRAVFDPDLDVRWAAVAALKDRPAGDYRDALLAGLRYPWPPVAQQSAEALAALKPPGLVASLVRLLDEPDPDAPFPHKAGGKELLAVRELVRINHLRNCLLCHPPSSDPKDLVRSIVPFPGQPPPQSFGGYVQRSNCISVRADITYLRQDFSAAQPVAKPGVWPDRQRYDFLVRTRTLTPAERTAWEAKKKGAAPSPYRRAVLYALCGLTGEYRGRRAADWQPLLRQEQEALSRRRGSVPDSK